MLYKDLYKTCILAVPLFGRTEVKEKVENRRKSQTSTKLKCPRYLWHNRNTTFWTHCHLSAVLKTFRHHQTLFLGTN